MDQYAFYVYLSYGITFIMLMFLGASIVFSYMRSKKKFTNVSNIAVSRNES